jgi:hypothetical protein
MLTARRLGFASFGDHGGNRGSFSFSVAAFVVARLYAWPASEPDLRLAGEADIDLTIINTSRA